jgi:hypothetical protein
VLCAVLGFAPAPADAQDARAPFRLQEATIAGILGRSPPAGTCAQRPGCIWIGSTPTTCGCASRHHHRESKSMESALAMDRQ